MISQRDSKVNISVAEDSKKIAAAAKRDSLAMKTVSMLTLIYLPGTFVAVRFLPPPPNPRALFPPKNTYHPKDEITNQLKTSTKRPSSAPASSTSTAPRPTSSRICGGSIFSSAASSPLSPSASGSCTCDGEASTFEKRRSNSWRRPYDCS